MRNFQDTFETLKRSFICDFSICMTVPLNFVTNISCFDKEARGYAFYFVEIHSKNEETLKLEFILI